MKSVTTFNDLRDAQACTKRYRHLAKALGGITKYGRGTPISLLQVLDICGIADAVWAVDSCEFTPTLSDAFYRFVEDSEKLINDAYYNTRIDNFARTKDQDLAREAARKAEKLEEEKQSARWHRRLTRVKKNVQQ